MVAAPAMKLSRVTAKAGPPTPGRPPAASPNGLPSESLQIAHRSPGRITLPQIPINVVAPVSLDRDEQQPADHGERHNHARQRSEHHPHTKAAQRPHARSM